MERRYVAIRAFGNPMQVFERVRQVVQNMGVTRTIPVVKFERKARREFFVFLAVEGTEEISLPSEVVNVLELTGLNGKQFWPLKPVDIRPMAGGTELETHSFNVLPYTSSWPNDSDDPFDLSDVSFKVPNIEFPLFRNNYDQLLHWLSATAEGTWQTFRNVCSILQLVDDWNSERSIFRRLTLLGHIENSENGQRWSICPTALVQCATDSGVCFLTGQQTPKLIEHLKEHWKVEILPQSGYQGPSCVRVHGVFPSNVSSNGFHIEHTEVVSIRLAQLLPDLEGWRDLLPVIDRLSTTTYNIEIWDGRKYIQCDNFYERHGRYFGESGLYRLTKKRKIILINWSFILTNQISDGCVETGMACVFSHTIVPDSNLKSNMIPVQMKF